jgi:hypothetical protein
MPLGGGGSSLSGEGGFSKPQGFATGEPDLRSLFVFLILSEYEGKPVFFAYRTFHMLFIAFTY